MLKLDGKTLAYDRAFTLPDGRQFPANWLRKSTLSEKNSIGITEEADLLLLVITRNSTGELITLKI